MLITYIGVNKKLPIIRAWVVCKAGYPSRAMTSVCTIHHGSQESIPSNASTGLLFLKTFLPILDSLEKASSSIPAYVSPKAQFIINNEPLSVEKLSAMLSKRREMLQLFKHDVSKAWEIQREGGCTVIFESLSTTQFKDDDVELEVAEMNVWELEGAEGNGGLKLVEARCWMDPAVVQSRAREIFVGK